MKKMPSAQPVEMGDPEKTPFVRFDSGIIYPPNSICEAAQSVLEGLRTTAAPELFDAVIKRGTVHGQYCVLPESTWYSVLNNFLRYQTNAASDPVLLQEHCVRALEIMVRRPCVDAWPELRDFLVSEIDHLSGWTSSFLRKRAEEQQVFQGEDGNYYYHNGSGERFRDF